MAVESKSALHLGKYLEENKENFPEISHLRGEEFKVFAYDILGFTREFQVINNHEKGADKILEYKNEINEFVMDNKNVSRFVLKNYWGESDKTVFDWIPSKVVDLTMHECSMFPDLNTYNKYAFQ